jgi:hypothetical protein
MTRLPSYFLLSSIFYYLSILHDHGSLSQVTSICEDHLDDDTLSNFFPRHVPCIELVKVKTE